MVLIVSTDLALAKLMVEAIPGNKECVVSHPVKDDDEDIDEKTQRRRKGMTAQEIKADEAQQQLRRRIYEDQPAIVLLDVSFGASAFRVLDSVPRILEEA